MAYKKQTKEESEYRLKRNTLKVMQMYFTLGNHAEVVKRYSASEELADSVWECVGRISRQLTAELEELDKEYNNK